MRLLREVASEIYSMFAGDAAMTAAAIAIVAAAATLRFLTRTPPIIIGFGLLAGCLVLLISRVIVYSRRSRQ